MSKFYQHNYRSLITLLTNRNCEITEIQAKVTLDGTKQNPDVRP